MNSLLAFILSVDDWLFFNINATLHTAFLDWFFLFFSFYPLIIWGCIGLLLIFIEERRDKLFIIRLFAALILAGALSSVILKPIVRRPRPDITHGVEVVTVSEKPAMVPFNNDYAFPSGHASVAFAGAYVVTQTELNKKHGKHSKKYRRWASWIFYGIAAITAFSRIYLGKHYPLDVVVGGILGVGVGWAMEKIISEKFFKNLQKNITR